MINEDFRTLYMSLKQPPQSANLGWYQNRGYQFEKIINQLLKEEKLQPRTSYKIDGEQIDGSFIYEGRIFLLEAKWHKTEFPASAVYQFKGKVDGKLIGTIGVFISMSGYSTDAVDALSLGKSLNVILFNEEDFDSAIKPEIGFHKVLETKLRRAAEEGVVYFPFNSTIVDANESQLTQTESYSFNTTGQAVVIEQRAAQIGGDIVIVCEGQRDRELISLIAQRIFQEKSIQRKLSIVVAMGKLSMPKVVQSVKSLLRPTAKLALVTDADDSVEKTKQMLSSRIEFSDWVAVIPNPAIEIWLSSDRKELWREIEQGKSKGENMQSLLARKVDLLNFDKLIIDDESFRVFYEFLIA